MSVADTIRDQIGHRALVMLGAHTLLASPDALTFRVRGSPKVSHVTVRLDPSDTYTLRFCRVRGTRVAEVAEVSFVYCDQLRDVISQHTGLYTSL